MVSASSRFTHTSIFLNKILDNMANLVRTVSFEKDEVELTRDRSVRRSMNILNCALQEYPPGRIQRNRDLTKHRRFRGIGHESWRHRNCRRAAIRFSKIEWLFIFGYNRPIPPYTNDPVAKMFRRTIIRRLLDLYWIFDNDRETYLQLNSIKENLI